TGLHPLPARADELFLLWGERGGCCFSDPSHFFGRPLVLVSACHTSQQRNTTHSLCSLPAVATAAIRVLFKYAFCCLLRMVGGKMIKQEERQEKVQSAQKGKNRG